MLHLIFIHVGINKTFKIIFEKKKIHIELLAMGRLLLLWWGEIFVRAERINCLSLHLGLAALQTQSQNSLSFFHCCVWVPFWLPPLRSRRRRRQLGFTTAAAMNSETAILKKKPLDDAKKKFKRRPLYSSMKKQLDDDSSSEDERTEWRC